MIKFAKAVYCAGVDAWYVRLGDHHGLDVMYKVRGEAWAKLEARLINESLDRKLRAVKARKQK